MEHGNCLYFHIRFLPLESCYLLEISLDFGHKEKSTNVDDYLLLEDNNLGFKSHSRSYKKTNKQRIVNIFIVKAYDN